MVTAEDEVSKLAWEAIVNVVSRMQADDFVAAFPEEDLNNISIEDMEVQPPGKPCATPIITGRPHLAKDTPSVHYDGPGGNPTVRQPERLSNRRKIMPSMHLLAGVSGNERRINVCWDSGATPNVMPIRLARALGAPIEPIPESDRTRVKLADGRIVTPLMMSRVPLAVDDNLNIEIPFILLPESSVLIGSRTMDYFQGTLDYRTQLITLRVPTGNGVTSVNISYSERKRGQTQMLFANTTVVPPRTRMKVRTCITRLDRWELAGSFAFVEDTRRYPMLMQSGYTVIEDSDDKHYYIVVDNPYKTPLKLQAGAVAAQLRVFDPDLEFAAAVSSHGERKLYDDTSLVSGSDTDATGDTELLQRAELLTMDGNELSKLWTALPELEDIDLSQARARCTDAQFCRLRRLIIDSSILWQQRNKPRPKDAIKCHIELKDKSKIFFQRTRPLNPVQRQALMEKVSEQLRKGVLEPSTSPYSSPVMLVPKPGGKLRFVVDLRALNKAVEPDSYTLPRIDEALSSLHGHKIFSALDLSDAFWSVELTEESKKYTSFQTPAGALQYCRMPQGFRNASAVFCRFIDQTLGPMKWQDVLAYVDDLIVFADTIDAHLDQLEQLFARLMAAGLTLGPKKCHFVTDSVSFIGHVVSADGVKPDPKKVKAVEALTLPHDAATLKSNVAQFGYYRRFIKNFSQLTLPLRKKIESKDKWATNEDGSPIYTEEERLAFYTVRDALKARPILGHPDWSKPFELHTDASEKGLGATLVQKNDNGARGETVISYLSRALAPNERAYHTWEKEALCVVWSVRLLRMYLAGTTFTVVTDSDAVRAVMNSSSETTGGRILRWRLALSEYDFITVHRKGKRHADADGLSRAPIPDSAPYGEGPTIVEPMPLLMLSGTDNGGAAFFGDEDYEAESRAKFVQFQANDPFCLDAMRSRGKPQAEAALFDYYKGAADGIIYTKRANGDRIYVPLCLRAWILRKYHGLPVGGHAGRRRTFTTIAKRYYWSGMRKDVRRWIRSCHICASRKTPRPCRHGEPGIVSDAPRPWHTVGIDLVQACATTSEGYTYILSCYDLHSRWVVAVPLRDKSAHTVGQALWEHVLCKFGPPDNILSDDGREFVNAGFRYVAERWGICLRTTGGYQPQALPTERWHRWLNAQMTMLSSTFGQGWDAYLPATVFCYNTSVHEVTGFAPYELMFGRTCSLLQDPSFVRKHLQGSADTVDWGTGLAKRMAQAYEHVRRAQAKMAEKNKKRRMKNMKRVEFKVAEPERNIEGDLVLYWEPRQTKKLFEEKDTLKQRPTDAPGKWRPRWTGPHRIIGRDDSSEGRHYIFVSTKTGKRTRAHVNKLVKFTRWSDSIISTSAWLDKNQGYRMGDWANEGSLAVVPLKRPYPFGVVRILKAYPNGTIEYQWLGNKDDNVEGTFLPGWIDSKSKIYYAKEKKDNAHRAYTGHQDVPMHQRQLVLHDFQLTRENRLKANVRRGIAEHPNVWWVPMDIQREQGNIINKRVREGSQPDVNSRKKAKSVTVRNEVDREGNEKARRKRSPGRVRDKEMIDTRRRSKRQRT
jgi:hypothetical protein